MNDKNSFLYTITEKDREIALLKERYYELTEKNKIEKLREQYEKIYKNNDTLSEEKIFVYTPTYNRGNILIERALKSVLKQSHTNFEYLIIGDCCTDNTEDLLKDVIKEGKVKFYNIPERHYRYPPTAENHWFAGPIAAANYALSQVPKDCKWIARIDDDDTWTKDHLQSCLNLAINENYEFITASSIIKSYDVEQKGDDPFLYGDYFKLKMPINTIYNPKIGVASSWVYRSYLKYFNYNEDCWRKQYNAPNELDLIVRFALMKVRIGYLDKVTCHIIPRSGDKTIGSAVFRSNPKNYEEHFKFD